MFLQHPLTVFLFLSFSPSVSQLARGCCHPHTPSWQQFTFRIAHVNTSMCSNMSRLLRAPHFAGDCFSGSDVKTGNMLNVPPQGHSVEFDEGLPLRSVRIQPHITNRRNWNISSNWDSPSWAADRSDRFTHPCVSRNTVLQHVTFSSSLLCGCVPISSTVQVEALGVVSMDTKQLAGIQNRTWRVAYLQALGARKS